MPGDQHAALHLRAGRAQQPEEGAAALVLGLVLRPTEVQNPAADGLPEWASPGAFCCLRRHPPPTQTGTNSCVQGQEIMYIMRISNKVCFC